jgi:uncharacterized membrane protein YhaH (DUF805 family)
VKEFRIKRAPYWGILLGLAVFNSTIDILWHQDMAFLLIPLVVIALFALTYARVRDLEWNGAWTLLCLVPLFNIYIGCLETRPLPPGVKPAP